MREAAGNVQSRLIDPYCADVELGQRQLDQQLEHRAWADTSMRVTSLINLGSSIGWTYLLRGPSGPIRYGQACVVINANVRTVY